MRQPLALFLAYRYSRAAKGNQLLSLISWFSLLGITLGVMALIIVLSVMNGFGLELKQRLLHVLPHGQIEFHPPIKVDDWHREAQRLKNAKGISGLAPYIEGQVMLSVPGIVRAGQLTAIDSQAELQVSVIDDYMQVGSLQNLNDERYGIVMGTILANQLGLWVGDKVSVIIPRLVITPAGLMPRVKRFTVVGVFEIGAQLDSQTVLINLSAAQKLYQTPYIDGLRVQTLDMFKADSILNALKNSHPDIRVSDWQSQNESLFRAIMMEKTMVSLLLFIVIIVAAFNIVSLLTMLVADKRSEIAVLRTMGASRQQLMRVFLLQAGIMGITGTLLGATLGCLGAFYIADIVALCERLLGMTLFDPNVFFIAHLPSDLRFSDVAKTVFASIVLTLLAGAYPAYRASKIAPASILKSR